MKLGAPSKQCILPKATGFAYIFIPKFPCCGVRGSVQLATTAQEAHKYMHELMGDCDGQHEGETVVLVLSLPGCRPSPFARVGGLFPGCIEKVVDDLVFEVGIVSLRVLLTP